MLLVDGVPVHLGGRGFDLLVALADRAGRVTHKDELLQAVWPGRVEGDLGTGCSDGGCGSGAADPG